MGKGNFVGKGGPLQSIGTLCSHLCKKRLNRSRYCLGFGFGCISLGSRSPIGRGNLNGQGAPIVKFRDFLQ